MLRRLAPAIMLVFFGSALASGCGSPRHASDVNLNPTLITEADLARGRADGVRDLHELISRIRPRWLDVRTDRSLRLPTSVVVYQNNARLGGVDALRGYPLGNISSIRYLDAAQAGQLPGASGGHVEGAIVISTAR